MSKAKLFATETDLVAAFCSCLAPERWRLNPTSAPKWVAYHETAGWDLLLAHPDGRQIGIEAKLSLNAKVLSQALPGRWADERGPDYRAVLVPLDGLQNHMTEIARHLGIVVLAVSECRVYRHDDRPASYDFSPRLPDSRSTWDLRDWPDWMPADRCRLPDYVPDVTGGKAAPVALTDWKIRAIKLLILLERRGYVTRKDMKALGISPTRWTEHFHGFLVASEGGYVRCSRTPDLKAQHPTNWAQIEADYDTWARIFPESGVVTADSAA